MPPKANIDDIPRQYGTTVSGKFIIIGVLVVALTGAAFSWWFRYNATHRAAKFWGPEAAQLIRDAPQVTLYRKPTGEVTSLALRDPTRARFDKSANDISQAPGLLHLRNALLEDGNFIWPAGRESWPSPAGDLGYWEMGFSDPTSGKTTVVLFSEDCRQAARLARKLLAYDLTSISTEPIAPGLREMFDEFSAASASNPATSSR